ncbi:MAG: cell wall-binding repeat-containing protein, partial [Acidimicrobiales bacterium]
AAALAAALAAGLVGAVALGAPSAFLHAQAQTQAGAGTPSLALVWQQHITDGGGSTAINSSSPNEADLTGGPSVVVGDSSDHVYAYHLATGSSVPGWPKNVGAPVTSTPSVVATTAGSTVDTVLVGTGNFANGCVGGYQWIYPDGAQQLVQATNPPYDTSCAHNGVQASMPVGTLQGQTATVAGSLGQETYAMNATSRAVLGGFPWFQADTEYATPAIGHLEGTGANQIVEGGASTAGVGYGETYTDGGHVRILSATGSLLCEDNTNEAISSSPAVGPFLAGGATGIVAGTGATYPSAAQRDEVIALNARCGQVWADKLAGTTGFAGPALADVLGNGQLQVVVTTRTGGVYALDGSSGAVLWHSQLAHGIAGSPVTMALGTGHEDVVVASVAGFDILTGVDGALLVRTVATTTSFQDSPLVTEDADGTIGITVAGHEASGSVVSHYEVKASNGVRVDGADTWPQFHHDPQVTGDVTTPIEAPAPEFTAYTRIDGQTADATAAAELEHQFPSGSCPGSPGSRPVVLATDATYADALASAYLARTLGTGTLLTPPGSLSSPTLAALRAEGVTKVFVVGGPLAVSTAVVRELESTDATACGGGALGVATPVEVSRISGATQYDTAERIAETPPAADVGTAAFAGAYDGTNAAGGTGRDNDTAGLGSAAPGATALSTAIVATGEGFEDAESASTLAYAERFPILLTTPAALSAQTAAALEDLGIEQVVVMGGPFAVSDAVVASLERLGLAVLRVAGQTASGTSVELASFEIAPSVGAAGLGWAGTGSVAVARGDGFSDGLAGAVVAGDGPGGAAPEPLVLTLDPTTAGTALVTFFESAGRTGIGGKSVVHLTVLGGPDALTQSVVNTLGEALGG